MIIYKCDECEKEIPVLITVTFTEKRKNPKSATHESNFGYCPKCMREKLFKWDNCLYEINEKQLLQR
jgi:hypothetical protein